METDDGDDRHLLSVDSVKVIAESIGISALDEEVCKRLTEDLEFRLKEVYINTTIMKFWNNNHLINFFHSFLYKHTYTMHSSCSHLYNLTLQLQIFEFATIVYI